jgi:hypothetical protein
MTQQRAKKRALFLCTHNSARSQMAEGATWAGISLRRSQPVLSPRPCPAVLGVSAGDEDKAVQRQQRTGHDEYCAIDPL